MQHEIAHRRCRQSAFLLEHAVKECSSPGWLRPARRHRSARTALTLGCLL